MIEDKLICKYCGHLRLPDHDPCMMPNMFDEKFYCHKCEGRKKWHDFKPTNLSYLEMKYEESLRK